jgi:integrase/recombinase XerD
LRRGGPSKLSTDAVAALMKKYGKKARENCLELSTSRIHPHLMRKTRAMHLYLNGMPLENIAKFLGHVDSSTISHYAQANLDMITAAIEKANPEVIGASKNWRDPDILKRLMGL